MTHGSRAPGTHRRIRAGACCVALTASLMACGDQGDEVVGDPPAGSDQSGTGATADGPSSTGPSTSTSADGGDTRVVVDGKAYRFAFHGLTIDEGAAAMNGVSEVCDPAFMGAAFRAEGYLVDDSDDVVVDNSILAGRIRLTLPTPGHEGEIPAEVSVLIVEDAIDGEDTLANGVPGEFTVDGDTASGRFEVPRRGASGDTYAVEVDVTCPG